jgi:hypothetical protein
MGSPIYEYYQFSITNQEDELRFFSYLHVQDGIITNIYDISQPLGSNQYSDIFIVDTNYNGASSTFSDQKFNLNVTGNAFFQELVDFSIDGITNIAGVATISFLPSSSNLSLQIFTTEDGVLNPSAITIEGYKFDIDDLIDEPSCFNEDTMILCLNAENMEEYIKIKELKKGNLVKTYKSGYRKILDIGKNVLLNNPNSWEKSMFIMKKTIDNNLIDNLIITGWHSILVDELGIYENENTKRLSEIKKIKDKYFLLSSVSNDFSQIVTNSIFTYFHFTLENDDDDDEFFGVYANGCLVEIPSKNKFYKLKLKLI